MRTAVDKLWGVLPCLTILFCSILVAVIEKATGDTFRILPRNLLICSGIVSIGIFLLWLNTRKIISAPRIFSFVLRMVSVFLIGAAALTGLFVMGVSHHPEHVVTKYGIQMVASVRSFLDEQVEYFEYKNWFFYGRNLGYEYYGSGGNDPLAQKIKPDPVCFVFYDLDGDVIESKGIE